MSAIAALQIKLDRLLQSGLWVSGKPSALFDVITQDDGNMGTIDIVSQLGRLQLLLN